jgi:hypothetical protein
MLNAELKAALNQHQAKIAGGTTSSMVQNDLLRALLVVNTEIALRLPEPEEDVKRAAMEAKAPKKSPSTTPA